MIQRIKEQDHFLTVLVCQQFGPHEEIGSLCGLTDPR